MMSGAPLLERLGDVGARQRPAVPEEVRVPAAEAGLHEQLPARVGGPTQRHAWRGARRDVRRASRVLRRGGGVGEEEGAGGRVCRVAGAAVRRSRTHSVSSPLSRRTRALRSGSERWSSISRRVTFSLSSARRSRAAAACRSFAAAAASWEGGEGVTISVEAQCQCRCRNNPSGVLVSKHLWA